MANLKIVSTETVAAPRLTVLEAVIERGLQSFVEVGNALMEIRDALLYRDTHATFEGYCRDRWAMTKIHAYRLMAAADTAGVISNSNPRVTPSSERVARPLTALPPRQQVEVWDLAVASAPDGKPTAQHVQSVVDRIKPVAGVAAPIARPDAPTFTKRQRELAEAAKGRFVDCLRHIEAAAGAMATMPVAHYLKAISVCTPEEIREMVRAARATAASCMGIARTFSDLAGIK